MSAALTVVVVLVLVVVVVVVLVVIATVPMTVGIASFAAVANFTL